MTRFKKLKKNCKNLQVFNAHNRITDVWYPIDVCYNYDDRLYKDKCNKKNCPLIKR